MLRGNNSGARTTTTGTTGTTTTGTTTTGTTGTTTSTGGTTTSSSSAEVGYPVLVELKLKFQGITKKPKDELNRMKVKVSLTNDAIKTPIVSTGDFTSDDSGIWSGRVFFTSVPYGDYYILVKGPKHVQRKICTATPSESYSGGYKCNLGEFITINQEIYSFDFTGIYMLPGDTPNQDGIVNSYDFSNIINKLNKLDYGSIETSDMNLDGVINALDYGIITQALITASGKDEK